MVRYFVRHPVFARVIINISSVIFFLLHVSAHEGHPQRKLREEYIYNETLSNMCTNNVYLQHVLPHDTVN